MSGTARTLFITQELLPYHATGGMAVLSRDLPEALNRQGWPHCYLLPCIAGVTILPQDGLRKPLFTASIRVDDAALDYRVFQVARPDPLGDLFFVEQERIFSGKIYDDRFRLERNLVIADAAIALLQRQEPRFDLVHALDQLSALSLACIRTATQDRFGLVFNILSAEYDFPLGDMVQQSHFPGRKDLVQAYGASLSGLTAIELGLKIADRSVTSSSAYAEHLATKYALSDHPENGRLSGISQGIDTNVWDPLAEGRLFRPIRQHGLVQDKLLNRKRLSALVAGQHRFAEQAPPVPANMAAHSAIDPPLLLSFVGRFCRAKGRAALYLLLDRLDLFADVELLFLIPSGSVSDVDLQKLRDRTQSQNRLRVIASYDQGFAELLFAASDYVLMPSEQEPGGLCQKMAMRFGALPLVTPADGLKSSVTDLFACRETGNGFVSGTTEPESYLDMLSQVLALPRDARLLQTGRRNAMMTDVSWNPTIGAYGALYHALQTRR